MASAEWDNSSSRSVTSSGSRGSNDKNESDDIRRSIDVLDQVLSEFDDIEPLYGDGYCSQLSESPTGYQEVPEDPPPIDRSLKPKPSPPSLPQKTRRRSLHDSSEGSPDGLHEKSKGSSSPTDSNFNRTHISASKRSESSSHEYQEINSDFCSNSRSKSLVNDDRERKRHRSNKEQNFRSGERSRHSKSETPLRKSRSEDISLLVDGVHRGRRSGRREPHQRRGKSTDRFLDHHSQSFVDPRMIPELGPLDLRLSEPQFVDPRFVDPRFCDPRFVDPRFFDYRFMDPNIQNQRFTDNRFIDPRLLDPALDPRLLDPALDPLFLNDPRLPFDGPFPMEDPMRFPHLMSPPMGAPGPIGVPGPMGVPGPISLSSGNVMDFHPHNMQPFDYPLLQESLMSPDPMLDYPYPLMDPQFDGFNPQINGYDPRLKNFDPSMIPPPILNHAHYPVDFPFNYPPDFPPNRFIPRERLNFDDRGRPFFSPNDPRTPGDGEWLPPTSEEARKTIQRLVRTHHHHHHHHKEDVIKDDREKFATDSKIHKAHGDKRRTKSTSHSDSSGRSSPLNGVKSRRDSQGSKSKSQREQSPLLESSKGVFRLGEAVRNGQTHREFGGKDTVSLPHFVSGGKDSGFDESPVVDESSSLTSPNNRGATPVGVGGGFVVAGVFSDSSKMYIPAPPSPTPDYDNEHNITDGEDSDIPQEPFYVTSKVKKKESYARKASSSSNRDSLMSEDSLQDIVTYEDEGKSDSKKENSLQTLMKEFQKGLPKRSKREDGRFSDDSLEDDESLSNVSPNRNSTTDCDSKSGKSMESLISMDGSTTSFDYMTDIHQKNLLIAAKSKRRSLNDSPTKDNDKIVKPSRPQSINANNIVKSKEKTSLKTKNSKENNLQNRKESSGGTPDENVSKSKIEKSKDARMTRQNSNESSEESKKDFPKFDTIRHLIKEGLIEGLDETPPDFAPPPPPKITSSGSEERSDSGIGSTASTNNRTDESGGSDNQSGKLSSTPPKSLDNFSSVNVMQNKTPSPPPLPPPRDSSMSGSSCSSATSQQLSRNQSWLYKQKMEGRDMNKNIDSNNSSRNSSGKPRKEKITHVDDLRHVRSNKNTSKDNLATQYAMPQDNQMNQINRNIFLENTKNLQSHKKKLSEAPSIYDDEASVSSHGSRSGRFFSRFTESMKSGSSRSNSPHVGKNPQKTKRVAPKVGPQFHADIIRAPRVKGEAPQPPLGRPPQFKSTTESPLIPLSRDGSGRFRSIEDLPDISSGGKSLELKRPHDNDKKKKKKISTLPPTITPSDMLEQERQRVRNKHKDESDGSKFKFNIFKGFWRRNKYSFDKM